MKKHRSISTLTLCGLLTIALTTPAVAEQIWVAPSFPGGLNSTSFVWPATASGFSFLTFGVPDDLVAFNSARVVLLPESTSVAAQTYQVVMEVKRAGEVVAVADWSINNNSSSFTQNTLQNIDISAQLGAELNATSAGNDIVSLFFWFPSGTGLTDARVVGMVFDYTSANELGPDSVGSAEVINNSLTAADLAANSVGASEIAAGAVGNSEIANSSVNSVKIQDGTVTGTDIATDTITAIDIAAAAVGNAELGNSSVNSLKILDGSVGGIDIANNTITASDIGNSAVGNSELVNNAVNSAKIQDGTVTGADIGSNTITAVDIATNGVTASEIASSAVRGAEITTIRVVSVECNGECSDSTVSQICNATGSGFEALAVDCQLVDEDSAGSVACGGDNSCFVNTVFPGAPLSNFCDDSGGWDAQVYCISTN